mgnify:CR=1 FL=1
MPDLALGVGRSANRRVYHTPALEETLFARLLRADHGSTVPPEASFRQQLVGQLIDLGSDRVLRWGMADH